MKLLVPATGAQQLEQQPSQTRSARPISAFPLRAVGIAIVRGRFLPMHFYLMNYSWNESYFVDASS